MAADKIKILGVAPYTSMKSLMINAARQFPNINLTVYVGPGTRSTDCKGQYG